MVTAITGGLGALGSIASGLTGADAASTAARQRASEFNAANQFQQGVYDQTRQDLSPYVSAGTNALYSLASLMGLPGGSSGQGSGALDAYNQFTRTPYYQFPLQQGEQGLDQSAAAKGLALSGGQMNALQKYAQNYAGTQFGNYMSGLSGLAGMGSSAAGTVGSQGNQAAGDVLNALSGAGNATAQGTLGATGALQGGLGNALALLAGGGSSGVLGSLLGAAGGDSSYQNPFAGMGMTM
ncbi:hypothetical protein [Gluconacetobacter azotocaptans]|uniref:hypothetical protein n=1 Tax=Gluconacetobacter azotocaptans TaxID=142834 RepID=UPI001C81C855|nr:hypothetical protein [Gluconacetobacter azotocaptans]GBQ29799.1 hypothetical protein AA13594_1482 [Gluconacetobacter azotocaptans DSM 13594]